MKHYFLALLAILALFSACQKDNIDVFIPDPLVISSVQGIVTDEAGDPVEGALASFNARTTTTDQNGFFKFENVSVNADRAYVQIKKDGFFHGSRAFTPKEARTHKISVQLLDASTIGSFDSASGGTVNFSNGASAVFAENAIINEDTGQTYTGQVNVAAKLLSPDAPNIMDIMPGDLVGIDTEGQEQGLRTFGMIALEMTAPNGDPLQLAEGSQANLSFPIPSNFQSIAPSEIPLWSFDEVEGIWKEEGKATLQGGNYIGNVSHFSYWNCDAPYPLVNIEGRLVTQGASRNSLSFSEVRIGFIDQGYSVSGFTNEEGVFSGKVPKNELLTLEVLDICGGVAYSTEIGPFDSATNLGDIIINFGSNNFSTLSGTITDCDGNLIDYGYVKVSIGSNFFEIISLDDGKFNYSFNACNLNTITIQGFDINNAKETLLTALPVSSEIDAGTLKTCEEIPPQDVFIEYTLDGEYFIIIPPRSIEVVKVDSAFNDIFIVGLPQANDEVGVLFKVSTCETGTYPITVSSFNGIGSDYNNPNSNNMFITFETLDLVSEKTSGIFSGSYIDEENITHTVENGRFELPIR